MGSNSSRDDNTVNHPFIKEKKVNLKTKLVALSQALEVDFKANLSIAKLIKKLVSTLDEIILEICIKHNLVATNEFCIIALGSYGREELCLYSDIDLLILHEPTVHPSSLARVENFIQNCWDIGLEIGHQITTVNACAELASKELTVISSILDNRYLFGNKKFLEELNYLVHPLQMWSSNIFYYEKQKEQFNRYKKYGETAYNLEPNVKYGPGGLRDIQTIIVIAKRHFGIITLEEGIDCAFLTPNEHIALTECLHFLWRIRFALHLITKKREERLLFDYQVQLAKLFNYQDTNQSLAIEQFMKDYFKVIKRSRELNEMLLQWFEEEIILPANQKLIILDENFQLCNNYIEVRKTDVFLHQPSSLLELFTWLVKDSDIKGVRANTIRLIHEHLSLIDESFKNNPRNHALFLDIFRQNRSPFEALQRMSRYGVLGKYMPCFASVTGQMQYDLFHVYTVDQHTLFVIRNLGRFLDPKYKTQFPLPFQLMATIEKKEILYLAAFFHDIGKGRGGDHSELGKQDATEFAISHKLDDDSRNLLIWLVKNHLLMSLTAQRQDIYDPQNILNFCKQCPHPHYLDYLYLLTVADICATNPTLWNAWKDSLLRELYISSQRVMQQTQTSSKAELIAIKKEKAMEILLTQQFQPEVTEKLWKTFKGRYFLHESPQLIARHTEAILLSNQFPLVLILPHHSQGGTEVFIYSPHVDARFTITTTVLNNHHLTIQEANIITCDNNFDLDTYIILDESNKPLEKSARVEKLKEDLQKYLAKPNHLPHITQRRMSRTQAHFKFKPEIIFTEDDRQHTTCLFLKTIDRPGLLVSISRVFFKEHIYLQNAKIATAGERVEDMFYITNEAGKPLSKSEQDKLQKKLQEELQRDNSF